MGCNRESDSNWLDKMEGRVLIEKQLSLILTLLFFMFQLDEIFFLRMCKSPIHN